VILHLPWLTLLKASFVPHFEFNFAFLFIITGVLGTTISPYMFFWEASQEVEERDMRASAALGGAPVPVISKSIIRSLRIDNAAGMIASEIATWSIIVLCASTLHLHGITSIHTSADAAKALVPLVKTFPHAGLLAQIIFSIGVIGLGLLSVPVLSGSASYAVAEAFKWNAGLNQKFKRAHGFYGVITIATLIGLIINYVGIDPIQALIVTSVLNGVVAVPLVFIVAKIAGSKEIMGEYVSGWLSKTFVWLTFFALAAAAIAMFATL
jgi:Mn2+/Fe2+ NRAMP family transporter